MHINQATSVRLIAADALDMSAARFGATTAAMIGLIGAVIGGLALARSIGRARSATDVGNTAGLRQATVALALGAIGIVLGGLIVATADGGLGTGNGLGGAAVAVVLGLIAVVLGGLARARGRELA